MPKNYKNCSKNLKKDFRLWKKSETFYFLNGIIDYGSLCIDYESLLKTVGQLLLIRSIYRIRSQGTQRLWMSSEFKSGEGSEFWLDRILMGIHEEFPWLKNRGKTIPENLLVFPEKKVMVCLAQNMVGILFPYHGEHCAGKKYFLCE